MQHTRDCGADIPWNLIRSCLVSVDLSTDSIKIFTLECSSVFPHYNLAQFSELSHVALRRLYFLLKYFVKEEFHFPRWGIELPPLLSPYLSASFIPSLSGSLSPSLSGSLSDSASLAVLSAKSIRWTRKKAKNATHNAKQFNLPLFIYLITLVIVVVVVVGLCPESRVKSGDSIPRQQQQHSTNN